MTEADIERIMSEVPELTRFGFGIFGGSEALATAEGQAKFKEGRAKLLASAPICTKICGELALIRKTKAINKSDFSYGLKHIVEKILGEYCSNGELICAAIYMGFTWKRNGQDDPNAYFNMSVRDIDKLRDLTLPVQQRRYNR
jgi:hypothetical protein